MKVLYDHQTFTMQDYGGISRIFTEILKASYPEDFKKELSLLFSNNEYLRELNNIRYYNFLKNYKGKYKVPAMQAINKLYTISKLKKSDFNIFHPTYYDSYFLNHLKSKPFVITFLDLIHERFQNRYPVFSNDRTIMDGKRILLNEADKIIAISESTKNDIIEFYGIDKNRIEVIYLGSSLKAGEDKSKAIVDGEYILFIGNRGMYKNFSFFLHSIADFLKKNKSLKLVCGGGGSFSREENVEIEKLGLKDQVMQQPFNNDKTLANLYSNALCFVFPSLYEGFGIPVHEAFSCGCPCAVSDRSSLPEVGGDAVVYFNPEDSNSIYNAVSALVNDSVLQQQCKKRGSERLSFFSWQKTIEQTFEVYRALI